MSWYKMAKDENYDEMLAWFKKRTDMHINLVKKYCKKIEEYDDRFKGLLEQAQDHDASKFEDPEIDPYVYVTWQYYCKEHNREFKAPEGMDDEMNKATQHHVKNNKHHPEFFSDKEIELINRQDRDKPPKEMVDATKMPDMNLAEMAADWMAVAEEKGTDPNGWADKNVNIRWKFTDEQKDLIYELLKIFKS
jgi:Mn-containing catalase